MVKVAAMNPRLGGVVADAIFSQKRLNEGQISSLR